MRGTLVMLCLSFLGAQGLPLDAIIDLLHGVKGPMGQWSYKFRQGLLVFQHNSGHVYLVIRRETGDLATAQQKWKSLAAKFYGQTPAYASVQRPEGPAFVAQNLPFPHGLDGYAAINAGLSGQGYPQVMRETTYFLAQAGGGYHIVSVIEPSQGASRTAEALAYYKSLSWIPPAQRIPWQEKPFIDFETGQTIGLIHIPQGFEYQGGLIRHGNTRMPAYQVQKGEQIIRIDHITLNTQTLQTGFGGNAVSVLTINGQSFQLMKPALPGNPQEVAQFLVGLWQEETRRSWQLEAAERRELPSRVAQQFRQTQLQAQQYLMAMGAQSQADAYRLVLKARAGNLVRIADIQVNALYSFQGGWASATTMGTLSLMAAVIQTPAAAEEWALGAAGGISSSLYIYPQASIAALQRWSRDNQRQNQWVRDQYRQQGSSSQDDFNSWMSRSWTNALSDQTYVRDPQSGEIEKVYKPSWDEGLFYRDPTFGYTIGGVEQGSQLQQELQQSGWYQLQESLSGKFGDDE